MAILTPWYRHISVHQGQDYDDMVSTSAVLTIKHLILPVSYISLRMPT